jgi:hypothetical protein
MTDEGRQVVRDVSHRWPDATVAVQVGGPVIAADGGECTEKRAHSTRASEHVRVAVPRADSQDECYHAPGGPCGSHCLRNVETTVGALREAGLFPCSNCVENHGLPAPDGGDA